MVSRHSFRSSSIWAAVALSTLLLSACGAEHPFTRGKLLASQQEQIDEPTGGGTAREKYLAKVRPNLIATCAACHDGSFVSGDANADYAASKALIAAGNSDESVMYQKAQGGAGHGGDVIWAPGAPELAELKAWIDSETQ